MTDPQHELRDEHEIREKLNKLQNGQPSERDSARLGKIRALRWVLKETVSL